MGSMPGAVFLLINFLIAVFQGINRSSESGRSTLEELVLADEEKD